MTTTHGFELLRETELTELKSTARLYRHVKTGAQLLSLQNEDENKCFGVTFRTPVNDSTGVAHILEHAVLCGSQRYPLKDPFIELAKGSLNTFLNAFTYPDKTCYPVASQNLKDFYNLVNVYLDTVFHPLLTEQTFQEQGWHYELEKDADPLIYKGVVFNEMKGANASPERALGKKQMASLFPDTIYHVDSGGDPRYITDLTYEGLKNFHQTYYHPSNSRIFFYGDDDPTERLRLLDTFLSEYEFSDPNSEIPLQPPFDTPREMRASYAMSQDEQSGNKGMAAVNWLLPDPLDPLRTISLDILEHVLLGNSAAPLRKSLIDSGLGEDLTGSGLDVDLRQMMFTVGLKGVAPENVDKIEGVILDTLRQLVANGIDPDTIEASMNTVEFALRENNTGSFPRGLSLMLRALQSWLYDGDPLALVAYEQPLATVKAEIAKGGFFEGLIQTYLLDNVHRSTVIMEPDAAMDARLAEDERQRLDAARAQMGETGVQAAVETTYTLQRLQATPDAPEIIATIPTLARTDLEPKSRTVPLAITDTRGVTTLTHDLFTNGIVYFELGMSLRALPQNLLPYVPLFGRSLLQLGTERENFVRLTQRIGQKTGGIGVAPLLTTNRDTREASCWLFLRGKATVAQTQDMMDIAGDILTGVRLDNRERFKQIALEEKARIEARVGPSGSAYISRRLSARFDEASWVGEQMGGISYLFFMRELVQQVENDWNGVLEKLEAIRALLVNRNSLLVNVTVDEANYARFAPQLDAFLAPLPVRDVDAPVWNRAMPHIREGLTVPGQVNYVGKSANLYELGYELHGSTYAVLNYLNTSWLWEKVRKEGGAYGVGAGLDRLSGVFGYYSYRDPNLLKTLANFDGASGFLRGLDLNDNDLTRAIIGGIGDLDPYQLPDAKGASSLARYLTGTTDELRQKTRDELLGTTIADFHRFGEALEAFNANALVGVVGAQANIEAANAERPGTFEIVKVL